MGQGDPHTIVGGIIELIHSDMLPIAFLVFVASLMVPLLKMVGISFLLISVQHSWQATPQSTKSTFCSEIVQQHLKASWIHALFLTYQVVE